MEPSDVVSIISGTTLVENVTVRYYPNVLLYNLTNHSVYAIAGDEMTVITRKTTQS